MKKSFIYISIILLLLANFTACDNKAGSSTKSKVKDELYGKLTLWSEENDLKALKIAGDNFIKINPKVNIDYVEVGKDNLYKKLLETFSSGKGLPDLITVKNDNISMYVNKFPDGFVDISSNISSIKNNFVDTQLSQCTYKGGIYGFPWKVMPSAVLYRKDIFLKYNIDPEEIKTWQDYIQAGETILKSSGGKTYMFPVDEASDDTFFRELLNQLNTGYFDKNGKAQFNSDKAIRAMKLIKTMNTSGIIYNNNGPQDMLNAVKNGTVATINYSCGSISTLNLNASELENNWGVIKFPSFEAGGNRDVALGGYSLMTIKASKNKKLATEFGKFAMTDSDFLSKGLENFYFLPANIGFLKSSAVEKEVNILGKIKSGVFIRILF